MAEKNDVLAQEIYKVQSFEEKPTEQKAAELIDRGAFWNAGVFAVSIGYVLEIVKNYYGEQEQN